MITYLCIIQARIGSTRFPNKVMETVGGVPMVKRVWNAAKQVQRIVGTAYMKIVVAWPERYPDLDENDVLGRFQRISKEFPSRYIIRLTADCPLIESKDIWQALHEFEAGDKRYYSNKNDGFDVQIFNPHNSTQPFHKEHVIDDEPSPNTGLSVNTKEDLMRVRAYAR
jgi:glutamate-1-semialdehyde 2,1-aminomutase